MVNSNISADLLFDFEALTIEAIDLEPNQIDQAVQLSSQIPNETRQWQTYLNALALFGFEQWVRERAPELPLNAESCSTLQPWGANAIEAVCNLEVAQFKVCLLTTGTLIDEVVVLPRAAIDLPEYAAHFYVVVAVQEEQEQATIYGFIRHDQLLTLQQSAHLSAEPDWTYELPLAWFERDPDRLFLYLRCLDAVTIPLPEVPTKRLASLSGLQAELEPLIPQLQDPNRSLWQTLTWEQGAPLLTSPELLRWLYRLQTQGSATRTNLASLTSQLSQILQGLTQQVINVGEWLQDELDEVSQNLFWRLLPAPAFANTSLRSLRTTTAESPTEEIEAIISQLRQTGMDIPSQARGACRDFELAENPLRLYAVTWPILTQPEWTLLLILRAQSGTELPQELKLQVSDPTSILVEQVVEQNSTLSYLYTRVIGTGDEQFSVTISLNEETQTFPPFACIIE